LSEKDRAMDGKTFVRLGALAFVGVAIAAGAIEMSRQDEKPPTQILGSDFQLETDAFRQILRRCRDIGEAATRDPTCLKAWADNRRRFLGQQASASEAAPLAPDILRPSLAEGFSDRGR
jgi:conjugative transfer region protein TrbK